MVQIETNPLLPKTGEPDSNEEKKESSSKFTRYSVGALLLTGALIGAIFKSQTNNTTLESKFSEYGKSASEVLLYKRTHPSRDAATDCRFLTETIGMMCDFTGTTPKADGDGYCAHRAEGLAGPISYHNIKDQFEPKGKAEEWIEVFNTHHEDSFAVEGSNQDWNQFMTMNTGLYTYSLDIHLTKWKSLGVKYKAHQYINPTDDELMYVIMTYNPSTGNVIEIHGSTCDLYSDEFTELPEDACLQAVAPGHLKADLEASYQTSIELYETLMEEEEAQSESESDVLTLATTKAVLDESESESESDSSESEVATAVLDEDSSESESDSSESEVATAVLDEDSSESESESESGSNSSESESDASYLRGTLSTEVQTNGRKLLSDDDLHGAEASSGLFVGHNGYPYSMFIKVSHPTNDLSKTVSWLSDNAQIDLNVHQDSKSTTCKVGKSMLSKSEDVGKASLMFVEVDANKDLHAKDYIEYVENVHKERMGVQRGYDRFIDSHIGLVYRDIYLDDIAPTLASNDASFMAFKDIFNNDAYCKNSKVADDCGSIWSTGTGGLSIEMHSFFSPEKTFFNGDFSPVYMDMCNSETNYGSSSFD